MAYEHREGGGTLFKNHRKEKETHPDMRGELMLNGTLYEVAAWTKEGKVGKWLSLSVKPKEERVQQSAPSKDSGRVAEMDEDLPF